MKPSASERSPVNRKATYVLAGGSMLALTGLLIDLQAVLPTQHTREVCQQVVEPQAVLSRDQLKTLLTVTTPADKPAIQAIVKTPYCILSPLETYPNGLTEREAYPLAFDPDTWLILHYTSHTYIGYDFSFQP